MGIDLQKDVHEDMVRNFSIYPKDWGLKRPDKNIDHRRVPNLRTFFARKGSSLNPTSNPDDYEPGDIVTWDLGKGIAHIGIVIKETTDDRKRHLSCIISAMDRKYLIACLAIISRDTIALIPRQTE
jgi:uncharacterized protein YijF (DUF1287 family)